MEEVSGSAFRTARASSFVPSDALVVAAAAKGSVLARVIVVRFSRRSSSLFGQ